MTIQNDKGPIAETYDALQGLELIRESRRHVTLERGSYNAFIRATLQAAEIAFLNLSDLFQRATADLAADRQAQALDKLQWCSEFSRLLFLLSTFSNKLLPLSRRDTHLHRVKLSDSPGYALLHSQLRHFENAALGVFSESALYSAVAHPQDHIAEWSLIQRFCTCTHYLTNADVNLDAVYLLDRSESYAALVEPSSLELAVSTPNLTGDTFLKQFRGLHQIPETLALDINDGLEASIVAIQNNEIIDTLCLLEGPLVLLPCLTESVTCLARCLTTASYHEIRENLGQTSGMHSVSLHYHLFHDLFGALYAETMRLNTAWKDEETSSQPPSSTGQYFDLRSLLVSRVMLLRAAIIDWKDVHLQLPYANLGTDGTRSLAGANDAVAAVSRLKDAFANRFPHFSQAQLPMRNNTIPPCLMQQLTEPTSFASLIWKVIGATTRSRFPDVQNRRGAFAKSCPFSAPASRFPNQ